MKTFKIVDGDFLLDADQTIVMTDGDEEIAQAIERCFTTNAGEWFLNALHGLEYDKIRGKGVTNEAIQMAVIKAATQDERVREVIHVDIARNANSRAVSIQFRCKLISGAEVTIPFPI